MKAFFLIFTVICTWLVQPGFAISHRTYTPPSGFGCIYDGIGASADGTVYFGLGNHTNDCVMLRYDPDADRFDQLGRISTASQAAGNWRSNDLPGKIHTSVHAGGTARCLMRSSTLWSWTALPDDSSV